MRDIFPMTERCFLMLAMLGGEANTTQIREGFARQVGERVTTESARSALRYLTTKKLPRVEVARAGSRSTPTIWRLTAHGHRVLSDDDGTHVPCGVGWPAWPGHDPASLWRSA